MSVLLTFAIDEDSCLTEISRLMMNNLSTEIAFNYFYTVVTNSTVFTFGSLLSRLLQLVADLWIQVQTGEIYLYVAIGFQILGIVKLLHTVLSMKKHQSIENLSALIKSGILIILGILVQIQI